MILLRQTTAVVACLLAFSVSRKLKIIFERESSASRLWQASCTEICVLPKVKETSLIVTDYLSVIKRHHLNPLTLSSDQHVNSTHNFNEMSVRQVLRIWIIISLTEV